MDIKSPWYLYFIRFLLVFKKVMHCFLKTIFKKYLKNYVCCNSLNLCCKKNRHQVIIIVTWTLLGDIQAKSCKDCWKRLVRLCNGWVNYIVAMGMEKVDGFRISFGNRTKKLGELHVWVRRKEKRKMILWFLAGQLRGWWFHFLRWESLKKSLFEDKNQETVLKKC